MLLLLAGAVAASLLLFGAHVYPVPAADSYSFVPPALMLEAGAGLRNPLSDLAVRLDPPAARYLQYPPLFQGALSLLMASPTPRAAFLAIAAINAANVLLSALLLARAARGRASSPAQGSGAPSELGEESRRPSLRPSGPSTPNAGEGSGRGRPWLIPAMAWVSLLAVATALAGEQNGRPEVLATFWALLSAHLHLALPPERAWPAAGLLLGLMAATHPVGGFLLGLLTVAWLAARRPPKRALALSAATLALGLAVFATVLALGPFGLRASVSGMLRHGNLVFGSGGSSGGLSTYWIANPGGTFYALPYLLLAALLAGKAARRQGSPTGSWWLLGAALAPLLGVVWVTGLRKPELVYNLLLFAPLVFAANLRLVASAPRARRGVPALLVLLVLAHGAAALGYLRALGLFGFFLGQGVPLEEARGAFRRLAPDGRVAVTPSLWVLAERYDRMTVFPFGSAENHLRGGAAVVQQNYSGRLDPPPLPGFVLVEDRFVRRPCEVLGLRLARTTPGYGFALYRRLAASPP